MKSHSHFDPKPIAHKAIAKCDFSSALCKLKLKQGSDRAAVEQEIRDAAAWLVLEAGGLVQHNNIAVSKENLSRFSERLNDVATEIEKLDPLSRDLIREAMAPINQYHEKDGPAEEYNLPALISSINLYRHQTETIRNAVSRTLNVAVPKPGPSPQASNGLALLMCTWRNHTGKSPFTENQNVEFLPFAKSVVSAINAAGFFDLPAINTRTMRTADKMLTARTKTRKSA
jgi:hypothetical protein